MASRNTWFGKHLPALRVAIGGADLMRVHACVTAGLGVVVSALLSRPPLTVATVSIMVFVVFAIIGAGNAINDFVDRDIDTVNRAKRPIASGAISPGQALFQAVTLFALGLGTSLFLSGWCMAFASANSLLLVLYAMASKRIGIAKDLIVGYLVGSIFLFGVYAPDRLNPTVIVLACCAALATVAREIVKDIEDVEGDRLHGATTLPIVLDARRSYLIAFSALAGAGLLSFVPYVLGRMNDLFLILNLLGCVIFVVAWFGGGARKVQQIIMTGSIVELAAFVVGSY